MGKAASSTCAPRPSPSAGAASRARKRRSQMKETVKRLPSAGRCKSKRAGCGPVAPRLWLCARHSRFEARAGRAPKADGTAKSVRLICSTIPAIHSQGPRSIAGTSGVGGLLAASSYCGGARRTCFRPTKLGVRLWRQAAGPTHVVCTRSGFARMPPRATPQLPLRPCSVLPPRRPCAAARRFSRHAWRGQASGALNRGARWRPCRRIG